MKDMGALFVGGIALILFSGIKTWRCFHQAYIQAPRQIEHFKKSNDLQNVERWEGICKRSKNAFQINGLILSIAILLMCLLALADFLANLSKPA